MRSNGMLKLAALLMLLLTSFTLAKPAKACDVTIQTGKSIYVTPAGITVTGRNSCGRPSATGYDIYLDGGKIGQAPNSAGGFTYTISTNGVSPGGHHVKAGMGAVMSNDVSVQVVPPGAGSIWGAPTVCNIPPGATLCTSTISWSSNRFGYAGQSRVVVTDLNNNNPQTFADWNGTQTGFEAASWINTSGFRFHLQDFVDQHDLAVVDVRGNLSPNISLTAPANGTTYYAAPASIPVSAQASDPDGSVSWVEFKVDGATRATVTSAPFQTSIGGIATGSHTITAVAFDNFGNSRASAGSTVTVRNSVVMGYVDIVSSGGVVSGWACSSYWAQSINVDVYAGGPYGTGAFIGRFLANQASEAAVGSACAVGSGSYRFSAALSLAQRVQYRDKAVYVYGISPVAAATICSTTREISLSSRRRRWSRPQAALITMSWAV